MSARLLLMAILFLPTLSFGHSLSDSYLSIVIDDDRVIGQWMIAVRDIELAVGLDGNADGNVTWGEILQQRAQIERHVLSRIVLTRNDTACEITLDAPMVEELNSGVFVHLPLRGECGGDGDLRLDYNLQFDIDSSHRGIVTLQQNAEVQSTILSPSRRTAEFRSGTVSAINNYQAFVIEGIWHIWIGLDHILFLVALLIPVVIR